MSNSLKQLTIASAVAVLCGASAASFAGETTSYTAAVDKASAAYQTARDKCSATSGAAQDSCVSRAKENEEKATDAAARSFMGSIKSRTAARVADAETTYKSAKSGCNDLSGNAKDVCIEEAKASQTKTVARAEANKEIVEARAEARDDVVTADYKVAITKCDAMTGDSEDACVAAAKVKFNQ